MKKINHKVIKKIISEKIKLNLMKIKMALGLVFSVDIITKIIKSIFAIIANGINL